MKNKQGATIPKAVLQSGESKFSWLQNIRNLSIGELIELYAFSEAVVETIREPIIVLDKNLRVKSANKSFFDFFKMTKKETYGSYLYDLNGKEWDIPQLKKLLGEILPKNHQFNNYEVTHDFSRLGLKIMLLNARRVVLEENKTELILLAFEDITQRKKLEKQKDEFVNIVSHELKTPITSMKALIQILQKQTVGKGDKSSVSLMLKASKQADKLTQLINELLNIGMIEAGGLKLNKKKTDLNSLIERVIEINQFATDNHEISYTGQIKTSVMCDENRIEQVLTNLISNAIKYSKETGKIKVKASESRGKVTVSVEDFGVGIGKKEIGKIFERFYRTEDKLKRNIDGFGLGLHISEQIIKRHKGQIWAESNKGKGSIFSFSLPLL